MVENDIAITYLGMTRELKSSKAVRLIPNATLATKSKGYIWQGDIDLHNDKSILEKIVEEIQESLYIFPCNITIYSGELEENIISKACGKVHFQTKIKF